ncbi:MAG: nucleotide-binding protein, partial [Woeseiaceae bacterium]|nr:nucleotide-binding protein [Woeseiaceae bacterium]
MVEPHEELLAIAERMATIANQVDTPAIAEPLAALEEAAANIAKAWSGSWWGYHAGVYYADLVPPPPGAHFSQEWGLMDAFEMGSSGDWREFDSDEMERAIYKLANDPDLTAARQYAENGKKAFDDDRSEALSILTTEMASSPDDFLGGLMERIAEMSIASQSTIIESLRPGGKIMTRDTIVIGQGQKIPAHIAVGSEVMALRLPMLICSELSDAARQAGSHLTRKRRQIRKAELIGTNVFIGHGQSNVWRDLKDFVQDRLKLPWDEFNRVPVAGYTNIARLSEMLDSATIAFLVMTGEDEQEGGALHARMNVVHEAGLFQGRLGFTRAIIVLEDGCEEFGNIEGLGQIRFPKGNIVASFEEIRLVLE